MVVLFAFQQLLILFVVAVICPVGLDLYLTRQASAASGGLKARGHPVGTSGLAQVVEIVLQLTGKAQYPHPQGVRYGLTQSVGGLATNNLVTIMEAIR